LIAYTVSTPGGNNAQPAITIDGGVTWSILPGYTVVVTNSAGSVTSNSALLNLIIAPSHAVITITVK